MLFKDGHGEFREFLSNPDIIKHNYQTLSLTLNSLNLAVRFLFVIILHHLSPPPPPLL